MMMKSYLSSLSFQVAVCVVVNQGEPRIIKSALVMVGQMLLAELHDLLVEVNHGDSLNRAVSQRLAEGCAFAATGDEHGLWAGYGGEARMDKRLVIDELVGFRRLGASI